MTEVVPVPVQTADAAKRLGLGRDAFLALAKDVFTCRRTPGGGRFSWFEDEINAYLIALSRPNGTVDSAKLAVLSYRREQGR